jgi:hypothetical protein
MAKITNTGVHIVEGSAAASDTGGESQIWVKSDTPSSLYHTDDAGTDFRINGTTVGTENTTTGGSSILFSGIPAGVKRISLMISGVSTSSTSDWIITLGDSGGLETSGYLGSCTNENGAVKAAFTAGIGIMTNSAAADTHTGVVDLYLEDSANNTWISRSTVVQEDAGSLDYGAARKSLDGVLTQVNFTTAGGSDTFDANNGVNIQFA